MLRQLQQKGQRCKTRKEEGSHRCLSDGVANDRGEEAASVGKRDMVGSGQRRPRVVALVA
jgi:hypothetical protein